MAITPPAELIEAARTGDAQPIERLVETVWPDAYRLARAILGDPDGAKDAAQEACIALYRGISALRSTAAFNVWFYRVVVREALRVKRHMPASEPLPDSFANTHDDAGAIDVWRALNTLPQKLREVVVLRYFEDLPSRDIAAILQTSDGTVRLRLMLARRRLRPLLSDLPFHHNHNVREVQSHAS